MGRISLMLVNMDLCTFRMFFALYETFTYTHSFFIVNPPFVIFFDDHLYPPLPVAALQNNRLSTSQVSNININMHSDVICDTRYTMLIVYLFIDITYRFMDNSATGCWYYVFCGLETSSSPQVCGGHRPLSLPGV